MGVFTVPTGRKRTKIFSELDTTTYLGPDCLGPTYIYTYYIHKIAPFYSKIEHYKMMKAQVKPLCRQEFST